MAEYESYKKDRLLQIYDNEYLNKFIISNELSSEFVLENFSVFDDCLSSLEICQKCSGFSNCKQKNKGEIIGINYDDILTNDIAHCKYYLINKKRSDLAKAYVYTDIPFNHYDLSLKNIDLDEPEVKKLFGLCYMIYEGNTNKGLYIYGDLGVGKTYMCIALANSLVANGKKVAFVKVNDFVTKMSELIREDVKEYDRILRKVKEAEYLILDDIGAENVSEFSRDRLLFNILDYRMDRNLCTIFTSNLDKDSLNSNYSLEQNSIKAKRLLERIDILSDDFCLYGVNKRRIKR